MPKKALRSVFTAIFLLLPLLAAAEDPEMDPAPGDWSRYQRQREPGEFKRTPYGLIDPSPDVKSLEYLPKDKYGFVDWAKAMKDGIIAPRESISPKNGKEEKPQDIPDIIIKSKMDFMPDVIFPHGPHTVWLKCSTCHPKIFKPKAGSNPISMAGIWKGKFCGRCHDRVAFPTRNCFKCHSAPRKARK